ncbi:MAG TPA: hypothetical protein VFQ20_05425 [Burkholderiaceae bacterium]|nr:hypothetical protein [Burkholderiaceae bacterium]
MNATLELAALAARLVVDEGLEYAAAKRKASKAARGARVELPSNEAIEDAVREELALFHADTQPAELRMLREAALEWLERLAEFRPHVSGAVWRGTATARSAIHLDLYADDPKAPEIALLNLGVAFDAVDAGGGARGRALPVLALTATRRGQPPIDLFLSLHEADDLRGALLPDGRGRAWRGDARALRRLLAGEST